MQKKEYFANEVDDRKRLWESEHKYRLVFDYAPVGIIHFDVNGNITACNNAFLRIVGAKRDFILNLNLLDLENQDMVEKVKLALNGVHSQFLGLYNTISSKKEVFVKVSYAPVLDWDNNHKGGVGIVEDITKPYKNQQKMKYLLEHDTFTGLYNRVYMESYLNNLAKQNKLSVGIIVCDIDGLKMVNDTLGYKAGDQLILSTCEILKNSSPHGIIARMGCDEFAIVLEYYTEADLRAICYTIKDLLAQYNDKHPELPLSLAIGYEAKEDMSTSIYITYQTAEKYMYRDKLLHHQSARSAIVEVVMKALEARDFVTEGHTDRLQNLVEKLAIAVNLSEYKINDLRLLARFHDIGKVGVPDYILFKRGPLTAGEFEEMKKHCEVGLKIAQASPDLIHISDWILKHHEWWNGRGYPLGLKGDEIPLECRILAIADAFDAMGSDRPYRKAMHYEDVLAELNRCSGQQFDPNLLKIFMKVLKEEKKAANFFGS